MKCPKCGNEMENLGNLSGVILTSYPPQWDNTYVCHKDRIKKVVREHGSLPTDYSYLDEYDPVEERPS